MLTEYAAADRAMQHFVDGHATYLREQLGPDAAGFTPRELFVVCNYLFRLDAVQAVRAGQPVDTETLAAAMAADRVLFEEGLFLKAIDWSHRGEVSNTHLKDLSAQHRQHSPRVAAYLRRADTERYRMAFRRLGNLCHTISDEVRTLFNLLTEMKESYAPEQELQVVRSFRKLHGLVQSFGFHGKMGAAMALSAGFHPVNVERAIGRIYLNRMDRLAGTMARIQFFLQEQGMNQNVTRRIWKQYDKLRAQLSDAVGASYEAKDKSVACNGPSC